MFAGPAAFRLFTAVIAVFWVGGIGVQSARLFRRLPARRGLVVLAGLASVIGGASFFVQILSAVGLLTLPPSREWPVGYTTGVQRTVGGALVVPLSAQGRVQVYDSAWHFRRGWNVDADGGKFWLVLSPPDTVFVLTARGHKSLAYRLTGEPLAFPLDDASLWTRRTAGEPFGGTTAPWLLFLTSPFLGGGIAGIGFLGLKRLGQL